MSDPTAWLETETEDCDNVRWTKKYLYFNVPSSESATGGQLYRVLLIQSADSPLFELADNILRDNMLPPFGANQHPIEKVEPREPKS